ncbi:MAG: 3',5'-cyclic-nucleotide phosphodiesterase [Pyrinomonadaceae bacterium]|nr:3',5'-cyclic-nucleotide phosphodiesterase [Pyrinomonadaceae bacterium]
MRLQLLPSTIETNGSARQGQHFTCFVINDNIAFDAGSLATSVTDVQRDNIRDIVLSHAHLDHVAGLPLFIDDLFATLTAPVRVHASAEVAAILERDIFNWSIYPRFSELNNENGPVIEYCIFEDGVRFRAAGVEITPVRVNHKVPTSGFIIEDGSTRIAMSGDTAEMDDFWRAIGEAGEIDALLIECAFPNELGGLANASYHLTPERLHSELEKYRPDRPVYIINMKPAYRDRIIEQIESNRTANVEILEVGRVYEF